MPIQILICDETTSPHAEVSLEIEHPPAPVSIKTIAKMAIRRARDQNPSFLPRLAGIEVILNMRLVADTAADSTTVPDNSMILLINRYVSPGANKGAPYREID